MDSSTTYNVKSFNVEGGGMTDVSIDQEKIYFLIFIFLPVRSAAFTNDSLPYLVNAFL